MNETTNSDLTAGTSPASTPAPSSLSATSTTAPTGPAIAASPAKSEQLALHGGEPVEPHPPVSAEVATKEPAEEHKRRKPGRANPSLKFAYWNGEELLSSEIGIELSAELIPDTNQVRLLKIFISDGEQVLRVKPSHLFRFLAQHVNRRLIFPDGRYANAVLYLLLVKCRSLTPAQMQAVSQCLIDLPSVAATVFRGTAGGTPLFSAGQSCREGLIFMFKSSMPQLPEGSVLKTRLERLFQAVQHNAEDKHLLMALSAMLSVIAFNIALKFLRDHEGAMAQAAQGMAKAFRAVRQIVAVRVYRQERAAYWRRRRFMQRIRIRWPRRRRHSSSDECC